MRRLQVSPRVEFSALVIVCLSIGLVLVAHAEYGGNGPTKMARDAISSFQQFWSWLDKLTPPPRKRSSSPRRGRASQPRASARCDSGESDALGTHSRVCLHPERVRHDVSRFLPHPFRVPSNSHYATQGVALCYPALPLRGEGCTPGRPGGAFSCSGRMNS